MARIKDRVIEYLKIRGITKQNFCEKTGISYANMVGKSLQSELGGDQIYEILYSFPDINPDWLLLGKGDMLRQDSKKSDAFSPDHDAFYKNFIYEKDKKIEELTRENEQLRIENEQLKSSSGNTGIVVQHDGGGNNYSINADMQQLAASQQKTILELTEQNLKLTEIIANKL